MAAWPALPAEGRGQAGKGLGSGRQRVCCLTGEKEEAKEAERRRGGEKGKSEAAKRGRGFVVATATAGGGQWHSS